MVVFEKGEKTPRPSYSTWLYQGRDGGVAAAVPVIKQNELKLPYLYIVYVCVRTSAYWYARLYLYEFLG